MDKLEKERQLFLESEKKRKKREVINYGIVMLILTIIILIFITRGKSNQFYEISSFKDFFDPNKIYFYILLNIVVYGFILLVIKCSVGSKDYMSSYQNLYRKEIVNKVLTELFTDVKVNYDSGFKEDFLREVDLISIGDTYNVEDYYQGKYKNISFSSCDIYTDHREKDKDGDYHTVVDFYGQYFIFEFNKKFKGNVKIFQRDSGFYEGLDTYVEMEDEEFNKEFDVVADDAHLAYYILTPNFMEKLKKLNKKHTNYRFAFVDNYLHIATYNDHDSFAVNPYKKLDIDKELENVREEVQDIIEIIDILDLDNELFK